MLSREDIYREMGKNIFICPLNTDNFRDNSVDLTASKFAWTSDGDYLFNAKDNTIRVPARKTACILTNESIYVSGKIGGTYHSRVSLAKMGFGHIGTMLDPQYCGQSLIMLHNTTDSDLVLCEGDRLVSLVFFYLSTPILETVLSTPPSHSTKVTTMDKEGIYQRWCNDNQWANNASLLKARFIEKYSKDFEKKKKIYAQRKTLFERIQASKRTRTISKYVIILVMIAIAFVVIHTRFTPSDNSSWANLILLSVICLIETIASDFLNTKR